MSKFPVKSAGTRLGKNDALPSKPLDGAGKKGSPFNGKIGGTGNTMAAAKSYAKRGK